MSADEHVEEILVHLCGKAKDVVKFWIRNCDSAIAVCPNSVYSLLRKHFSSNHYSPVPLADFYTTLPEEDENPYDYWLRLNKAADVASECLRERGKTLDKPHVEIVHVYQTLPNVSPQVILDGSALGGDSRLSLVRKTDRSVHKGGQTDEMILGSNAIKSLLTLLKNTDDYWKFISIPSGTGQNECLELISLLSNTQRWRVQSQVATVFADADFCYNGTVHETTGFAPFYLMFGRVPRLPIDVMFQHVLKDDTVVKYSDFVSKLKCDLGEAAKIAQKHSSTEQAHHARIYNQKVKGSPLAVSDRVLLANCGERGKRKIADKWESNLYEVMSTCLVILTIIQEQLTGLCSLISPTAPKMTVTQLICLEFSVLWMFRITVQKADSDTCNSSVSTEQESDLPHVLDEELVPDEELGQSSSQHSSTIPVFPPSQVDNNPVPDTVDPVICTQPENIPTDTVRTRAGRTIKPPQRLILSAGTFTVAFTFQKHNPVPAAGPGKRQKAATSTHSDVSSSPSPFKNPRTGMARQFN
ncbi:hypothetical protein QQF64_036477 [Cirrhinus molitorella]|uniref:Uncharacterized protein n=1 Tax=Cirrhinus molitorella TaxID=172907 RepID=A0ABR3NIR8_9TELE